MRPLGAGKVHVLLTCHLRVLDAILLPQAPNLEHVPQVHEDSASGQEEDIAKFRLQFIRHFAADTLKTTL